MIEGNIDGNAMSHNAFTGKTFGDGAVAMSADLSAYFTDPDKTDFSLKGGSGLVGAGSAEFEKTKAPGEDFAGNKRPLGGSFDVGAYEFAGP